MERQFLDDIVFTLEATGLSGSGADGLYVSINQESLTRSMRQLGIHPDRMAFPIKSLKDLDGTRTVFVACCTCGFVECGGVLVRIEVARRFVRWTLDSEPNTQWIFDRSSYRESLAEALEDWYLIESQERRQIRHLIERTPWDGPVGMGLQLDGARVVDDELVLRFQDDFWGSCVRIAFAWDSTRSEESLRAVAQSIATWDVDSLDAEWYGLREPSAVPGYPSTWKRRRTRAPSNHSRSSE